MQLLDRSSPLPPPVGLGFFLPSLKLVLLFLNVIHEFLYVLEWIAISLVVSFTTRTVHELVLLTH